MSYDRRFANREEVQTYDRRQASASDSLASRLQAFFEETAQALQTELRAAPKRRVEEKKLGVTYTVEVIVNPELHMYDRKVTFQIDGATIHFAVEVGQEERPGQFTLTKASKGTASINISPNALASAVTRSIASSTLYSMY